MASTREDLYQQFGPKLMEALTRIMMNEINLLRDEAGLPRRTTQQLIDQLQIEIDLLDDYDWMNGQISP